MKDQVKLPTTLQEAIKYFADPQACLDFTVALRWPQGPVCPLQFLGASVSKDPLRMGVQTLQEAVQREGRHHFRG